MFKKKICGIVMAAVMAISSFGYGSVRTAANDDVSQNVEFSQKQPFVDLTADELREDMGAGWNLGNTMDGHTGFTPGETVWQNVKTTKKLIKKVHDLGFNTVRIPVTWGTMIDDENGYAINEAWISRVQDIVDYCISQDMYVLINIHHDGAEQTGWLRIATKDYNALAKKFEGVWKNIASYFKDYDEHLIFEAMNEVKGESMTTVKENQVIMKLNQIFVDTVRATGSNNAKRWLMVTGKYNFIDSICNSKNEFKLPNDTVQNRLILSVHDYSPWSFCGLENADENTYSLKRMQDTNVSELKQCYDTYTSKGIPVVVGEYGCINKDNPKERAFYIEGMNRLFKKYKLTGIYWDQGWYDRTQKPDYSFSIVDRETGEPIEKEVTDALMRGYYGSDTDISTLKKSPQINKITSINVSEENISLKINESKKVTAAVAPENTNDIVLWKTDNPDIATVSNGKINAKGIGETVVTAFSQSGSVEKKIQVNVEPEKADIPCESITMAQTEYSLEKGDVVRLAPAVSPENTTETLYYTSSDEEIATVSCTGKIVALNGGSAVIMVHSTGGIKAEVTVNVNSKEQEKEINLAINVYYNDNTHNYWSNEISKDVKTISENGQYELTFDCNRDLSDAAVKNGVKTLNKVTAIYIKDYDVSCGKIEKSALSSCSIRYDKVTVNGEELKVTNNNFKSALKESGIFDTNDPINAWDGNVIDGVSNSGSAVSFTNISNPQKLSITFTLDNMSFDEKKSDDTPQQTESPQETKEPQTTTAPQKASETVCKNNNYYKIYNKGAKSGKAEFTGLKNKKTTKVTVADKIIVGKKTYKITGISKNACKGNKYLKSVIIGKNITSIGQSAFAGCTKVGRIEILTDTLKIKNVQKKAFYKIKKNFTVKCNAKKKTYYKKLIKSRR